MFWRPRDLGLRSHVAVGIAALALVGVDASVAATRGGGGEAPTFSIADPATSFHLGPHLHAEGVASGHRRLWVLVRHDPDHYRVEDLRPSNLETIRSIPVPSGATGIYFGAGRVWVSSAAAITAIDPASGRSQTHALGSTVDSMAFVGSTAYAVGTSPDELLAITAGHRLRVRSIEETGDPVAVVALSRAVEVAGRAANLVPVILPGANTSYLAALDLGQPIIGSAGPTAAWVARGRLLVLERLSASGRLARKYFRIPGHARRVLTDPRGGCYVAVGGAARPALLYIPRAAIRAELPRAFAIRRGAAIASFALDPVGGVVYTTFAGQLRRWIPPLKWLR